MDTRKYIFENGMMRLNPAFKAQQANQGQVSTAPVNSLAIVSSTDDIMQASQAQLQATGQGMQLSQATTFSMEIMQDQDYLNRFHAGQKIDGGQILDGLSNIFSRYEVPIGLVNKLLALTEYKLLNFIVDDSGSMSMDSDAPIMQASPFMKHKFRLQNRQGKMTRWEEAEDRIHVMIDMLAYIPNDLIKISFLNRSNIITLTHQGKTPEQFAQDAHQKIAQAFSKGPSGGTPIYTRLSEAFGNSSGGTMHYLFTDGVPNDRNVEEVKKLVLTRNNPQMNPLTFMSCTDNDDEANWMKEIEEDAPFTAELDDFASEAREVLNDQGPGFPFTRGFWLLCQLVAAINPYDLDALDESTPFTKMTLDNLMGRKLTLQEYDYYFRTNPNAQKYQHLYQQFCREDIMAHQIPGVQTKASHPTSHQTNVYSTNNQTNVYSTNNAYPNNSQNSHYSSNQLPNQNNNYNASMSTANPSFNQYQSNQSGMMSGGMPTPNQGGFTSNQSGFGNGNPNNFANSSNYNPGLWNQNQHQSQMNNPPQMNNQSNNTNVYNNRPRFGR